MVDAGAVSALVAVADRLLTEAKADAREQALAAKARAADPNRIPTLPPTPAPAPTPTPTPTPTQAAWWVAEVTGRKQPEGTSFQVISPLCPPIPPYISLYLPCISPASLRGAASRRGSIPQPQP